MIEDPQTGQSSPDVRAVVQLNQIYEFAARKRDAGALSAKDFESLCVAGGLDGPERLPRTPAQAIAAAGRMVALLDDLYPALAEEFKDTKAGRSR